MPHTHKNSTETHRLTAGNTQGAEHGTTKSCLHEGGEIITIAGEAFGPANAKVNTTPAKVDVFVSFIMKGHVCGPPPTYIYYMVFSLRGEW